MKIDFIDLKAQQALIRDQIESNIKRVLDHGQYIMGPEVFQLEEALADYVGVKHCVGVSSGTDALLIAMMSLGVEPGDEVITSPFTFIATGEMIALLGAKPVFVDIDPRTYNLDPRKIEAALSSKTKAIMPVSLYGQCADLKSINEIADKHGLPVIEDAAQSFGATHYGKKSCALSTIGCTSFFPSKPLGGYGDGGACFTDDDELAKTAREIRVHGQEKRYHHTRVGINGRLDTLQAAVLLAKFEVFQAEVEARGRIGDAYSKGLVSLDLDVPYVSLNNSHVYAQYTIKVKERDEVADLLKARGIPIAVHYPISLECQPALGKGVITCLESASASETVMSLPMHPYLGEAEILHVCEALTDLVGEGEA